MLLQESITEKRRSIGMNNNVLGWVNLIDEHGFVRWQGSDLRNFTSDTFE